MAVCFSVHPINRTVYKTTCKGEYCVISCPQCIHYILNHVPPVAGQTTQNTGKPWCQGPGCHLMSRLIIFSVAEYIPFILQHNAGKHDIFVWHLYNVGPTLYKRYTNIFVFWDGCPLLPTLHKIWCNAPAFVQRWVSITNCPWSLPCSQT